MPPVTTGSKVTSATLAARKKAGEHFAVLTCYDHATAQIMAEAGLDVLLVGDTAAEVVLGYPNTRPVGFDFLLELTKAVRRGAPNAYLIGDMPFSAGYQDDPKAGVAAAQRFVDEAGCDIVKVELTAELIPVLTAIREAGIDVMAHIGLRPQGLASAEEYRAVGRDAASAAALIELADRMVQAGATMLLLEAVASEVSEEICRRVPVPVIGCVAGPACDGTVVVLHDMLGWGGGHPPRSVRRYADLYTALRQAFAQYGDDVRAGRYPSDAESIHMRPGEAKTLADQLRADACSSRS